MLIILATLSALALQDSAQAIQPAPALDAVEDLTTPAPPPTDAATLIAGFDAQYTAWGDLIAELAGRKARERYLAQLLLPVITRPDLDEGASGEILRETRDTISEVETANTQWALAQLEPERFAALELAQPRLAADILRWAERDEMADALAMSQNNRQIYGTVSACIDGQRQPAPVQAPDDLDARRMALGLAPMAEAWTTLIAAEGETCELPSPSP